SYSENGKQYLIKISNNLSEDNKNAIETKSIIEQIRKDFKLTTSNSFEGYKISKYYGIASGSTVLGTGFLSEGRAAVSDAFGIENDSFSDKLEQARNSSIKKMIDEAIKQGGNALIGVSFDYINFTNNLIGVVANGTVVEIAMVDE
ncbi:MAG: YbjQ family protein, partial [Acetatifactor sp.]|nr:YbjQ family protein [Acetatifactor sp.]